LLLVLAFLGSGRGQAEWVELESQYQMPGLQTVYIDPASVMREGELVTVSQLTDYRWMQGGPRSEAI
jgi:hypothetical protein